MSFESFDKHKATKAQLIDAFDEANAAYTAQCELLSRERGEMHRLRNEVRRLKQELGNSERKAEAALKEQSVIEGRRLELERLNRDLVTRVFSKMGGVR